MRSNQNQAGTRKKKEVTIPQQLPSQQISYWTWWLPLFGLVWLVFVFTTFRQPIALIQQNWPLIFVGLAAGLIGNITAVGGGIVFVPAMLFAFHLPAVMALKVAIASQVFGMTSGAIGWLHRGLVPLKALQATVPGLLIGSSISSLLIHPNALLVKGLFGPVSIILGILTLTLLNRHRSSASIEMPARASKPLFLVSIVGGLLTGWVAIGEGEVIAAFLMLIYGFNPSSSIGLGVTLLSINSIYLALIHNFVLGGIPWHIAAFTILGCVYGARLGPYLSQWIPMRFLRIGFAVIAILDGLIFLLQFLLSGPH